MAIRRENGSGSIYKRADAYYRPWVAAAPATYIEDPETGRRKRCSQILGRYASRPEARRALEAFNKMPTDKYNATVSQIFELWQVSAFRNIGKSTQDNYNAAWRHLAPIHAMRMRELRTPDMQSVIDDLADMSYSSLSKIKGLLHQLCNYASQNDIVLKNYATFISLPRKKRAKKDCFTPEELDTIRAHAGRVPFADAIMVMCYTGFRVSEFLALRPQDYDPVAKTLTGGSKTDAGRDRIVPVHSSVQPHLDAWLAKGGKAIFCKRDGGHYSSEVYRRKCFAPAIAAMGLRPLTPHATRHTCATMLSAAGARPEDIQRILGHEDYDLTANTYIHQSTATLRAAIDRLDSASVADP